jgi:hypothetical protein
MTLLDLCAAPEITGDGCLQRVARLFVSRPNEWIDGRELAQHGGFYAFRTRVSDCRKAYGMTIENRVRRVKKPSGGSFQVSEYRWVP